MDISKIVKNGQNLNAAKNLKLFGKLTKYRTARLTCTHHALHVRERDTSECLLLRFSRAATD